MASLETRVDKIEREVEELGRLFGKMNQNQEKILQQVGQLIKENTET